MAKYNDLASVEALLKAHECAAVILEPVVGNSGFIAPTQAFLEGLRKLTTKYGALLVFDEVRESTDNNGAPFPLSALPCPRARAY